MTTPATNSPPSAAVGTTSNVAEACETANHDKSSSSSSAAAVLSVLDFIGPSSAVKNLFSLPYNSDRSVSVACHNMGNGTLLLDSWEDDYFGVVATTMTNNTTPTIPALGGGTRGRRRHRPSSWNNSAPRNNNNIDGDNNDDEDDDERQRRALALYESTIGSDTDIGGVDEDTDNDDKNNTLDLDKLQTNWKLSENERSLLSSLSLLLDDKEEGEMKHQRQLSLRSQSNNEDGAIIVSSSDRKETIATTKKKDKIVIDEEDNNIDPMLYLPQDYLTHYSGVSLPTPPRQYVNWKFRNMKLLVGSDAMIYDNSNDNGGLLDDDGENERGDTMQLLSADDKVGERTPKAVDVEVERMTTTMTRSKTTTSTGSSPPTIAILLADAAELKSQMIDHMVKTNMDDERGFLVDQMEEGMNDRLALSPPPPSSYAEALLKPPSSASSMSKEEVKISVTQEDEHTVSALDSVVKLQTCIIPTSAVGPEWANEWEARLGFMTQGCTSSQNNVERSYSSPTNTNTKSSPSGVCTVLDAYLDNIMANVPQLALILREHGFVQNIKLMRTEDIPSLMMHPSTLNGSNTEATTAHHHPTPPQIFSPDIVEMNAAMLLQFLKTNCRTESSTFLVHRAAGETNIQLFDISSISKMRQRKWTWWLALCSYRFACRLEQLVKTTDNVLDGVTRREYRNRQRNLLLNTLDLLEELKDIDENDNRNLGGSSHQRRHDTIGAAVCEHLADTYLWNNNNVDDHNDNESDQRVVDPGNNSKSPAPYASCQVKYARVPVDSLNKAHDHLICGVKKLMSLLNKAWKDKSFIEIEAISTQLYGLHYKLSNVNLRLADRHLQNYFASNLIQSLRTSARVLADTIPLLTGMYQGNKQTLFSSSDMHPRSILLQYAWLWEYCGHFARSFVADPLWRDRGHTCGQDLIGLFQEVSNICSGIRKQFFTRAIPKPELSVVSIASHGQVSLKNNLSGIVILPEDFELIETSVLRKEGCHEAIGAAKLIIDQKTEIKRDACLVLVAASICYGHAIDAHVLLESLSTENIEGVDCYEVITNNVGITVAPILRQRLGDACNEIGKILLQESRAVLTPQSTPPEMSHVSAIMLASSQFWFVEGLKQFTIGNDLRNIALLRCNLCQCCKIRANTNVVLPEEDKSARNNPETYLQEAIDHLVSAHNSMVERDADPITWDMVSEELAATYLVLGVRRRQTALSSSSEPLLFQASRLTPGVEKAIVEPMERSCLIYESLGTPRASHQAAAAHYQLALYFSKVWTCQRDEVKTRDKLGAAFKHYGLAHQYFFQHIKGNEATFIVLSLDLSNLYSAVSGEAGEECLRKALMCCLDTRMAFALPVASDVNKQMTTLIDTVTERISKLLLSLVKIEKDNNTKLKAAQNASNKYKDMYRQVLVHKMSSSSSMSPQSGVEGNNTLHPVFVLLDNLFESCNKA